MKKKRIPKIPINIPLQQVQLGFVLSIVFLNLIKNLLLFFSSQPFFLSYLVFSFFFFLSQSLPLYLSSVCSTLPKKSFFFSISSTIHQSLLPNGLPPLPHQDSFIFQKKLQHLFPSQCGLLFPHSQNSSFPRIELN